MILIAMDSWKGSLSAEEAGEAVARGIARARPDLETLVLPLADGGEGTLETVARSRPGQLIRLPVTGPLPGRTVEDGYLFWPDTGEALIEMAKCAGLPLMKESEKNPLLTTTRGVGEWILDAVDRGARTVTLALGGSATVDGGSGMARALGWRFLDENGEELPDGGGSLVRLKKLVPPPHRLDVEIRAMCDVTNPLLGSKGAAQVFGPQKGATPAQVELLEQGLSRMAEALREATGKEVAGISGSGAAGGMGAGCVGFLQGSLVSGSEELLRMSGIDQHIRTASHLVTGEGKVDSQSLDGKVVSGLLKTAAPHGVPVSVIAGSCDLTPEECKKAGLYQAESANHQGLPLEEALSRADSLAEEAGFRLAAAL